MYFLALWSVHAQLPSFKTAIRTPTVRQPRHIHCFRRVSVNARRQWMTIRARQRPAMHSTNSIAVPVSVRNDETRSVAFTVPEAVVDRRADAGIVADGVIT
jgi:hypothetical protein